MNQKSLVHFCLTLTFLQNLNSENKMPRLGKEDCNLQSQTCG